MGLFKSLFNGFVRAVNEENNRAKNDPFYGGKVIKEQTYTQEEYDQYLKDQKSLMRARLRNIGAKTVNRVKRSAEKYKKTEMTYQDFVETWKREDEEFIKQCIFIFDDKGYLTEEEKKETWLEYREQLDDIKEELNLTF
ncbi:hypothetical protein ABES03_08700 [Neobacillus rhizosphaerae]|uniref:hypothetical protein n=1 Tax=Neobacillus rhizosphaerae TaxID=2880965 RepID=UPI003D27ACAA